MKIDINHLEKIGLTKSEAKVYLELLRYGSSTKTPISKLSGVSQSKIYEVLDRLIKKGLCTSTIVNGIKRFQVSSPEKILYYLDLKKKDIENDEKYISNYIPALNELYNSKNKLTSTKVYEGMEGFKTMLSELSKDLNKDEEYLGMGAISNKKTSFNIYWKKWHKKRVKLGVKARILFSEKIDSEYYSFFKDLEYTSIRKIEMITPSAVAIYKDKTIIFDYSEKPSFIQIENEKISKSFRSFFSSMWKIAKP
ncbi:MAG: helix-turn-helix domain-containing protein [archaeon]